MKYLEELKETLGKELEKFAKQGDVSVNTLEKIHKLADTYKDLCKIALYEETPMEDGASYRRGRGRNAKRDSMGRYSREDGYSEEGGSYPGTSYEDGMSYTRGDQMDRGRGNRDGRMSYDGDYSRHDAKDWMMTQLGEMMEGASQKDREALKQCMRAIERD